MKWFSVVRCVMVSCWDRYLAFSHTLPKISYAVPSLTYRMGSVSLIYETEDCSILKYSY